MEYLKIHEKAPTGAEYLLMAFKGWPDAGEAASSAVRHLLRKLGASRLTELDPEEFYDFSQVRPYVSIGQGQQRLIRWPENEFFYGGTGPDAGRLVYFIGVEPNLKWKTYSRTIIEAAADWGIRTVIHVGALLDAVPHTRPVQVSGSSNQPDISETLREMEVSPSSYQGPTGITSAIQEACHAKGLGFASVWGHTPHYLQAAPNYRVGHALAVTLTRLLSLSVPLDDIRSAGETFDREVDLAVGRDDQVAEYVTKLEQHCDEATVATAADIPQPAEMVQELERFLRERRGGAGSGPS